MANNLTAGSIAFTGYNGSGNDNISFVVLTDIAQGTVINFTDNSWNGSSFANSETIFSWTATGNVAAGTVIDINTLKDENPGPSTNVGSVAWVNASNTGLKDTDETVYAYVGSASNPTFLAAIANHGFSANGVLTNTGLELGKTAIDISGTSGGSTAKSGYNGARSGEATFADYLNDINNKANWLTSIAAPFPVDKFTTTVSTAQSVSFSPATVSVTEGDNGTKTLTFTVTRSGDTTGAITFSGTFDKGTTNAADFGGTLPSSVFNGTIAAGATSATVTIVISGDTTPESSESFTLTLNSASNPSATVTIATASATGTIANDDGGGTIISSNTSSISFGGNDHVTIQQGVTVSGSNAATWTGGSAGQSAILDNFGNISGTKRAIATGDSASNGNLTINNEAGATIQATKDAIKISNLGGTATGTLTIVNDGTIKSTGTGDDAGQALDLDDNSSSNAHTVITNNATGLIQAADADAIRAGINATINNYGQIISKNGSSASDGNDAIDFQSQSGGVINNYEGGLIDGARHGITGDAPITVNNNGTITGESGSGINLDSAANTTTIITNSAKGIIVGHAVNGADADGIDVDGLVAIDNFGTIKAVGLSTDGLNEALAVGGGSIHNEAGGQIISDQRAITVDDSNDGNAFGATTIVNQGTIQGGNGEAISITGTFADTVTNKGSIIGSVAMGAGNDTFNAYTGSSASGTIDGGDGNDTVHLAGAGIGTFGETANVETLDVDAGIWMVDGTGDYDAINIAAGATLTSSISVDHSMAITVDGSLAVAGDDRAIDADGLDNGLILTVEVGKGGVISSSGNDAIGIKDNFDNGQVTIDNSGTITSTVGGQQALDLSDLTSTSTTIHITNENGGLITAVGGDAIRGGGNTTIDNYGAIVSAATTDDLNDGIDFQDDGGGTVHNYAGGSIMGAGHGITGTRGITVINDVAASITGQSGSAVNIDNDSSLENMVTVINRGTMLGQADASQDDSDGDAVDVDGLLKLDNYGLISGTGANGTHKGGANVSEGVAAGGGTINNYAGGMIHGYGRAIQIDNSENGGAAASTIIYNEGTIQGDGNGPENFEAGSDVGIVIEGREAIDILGENDDTITNKGMILGGVFTDGGDDTFNADAGSTVVGQIDLGAGDDTFNVDAGSTLVGKLDLGDGNDTVHLAGGDGAFAKAFNAETLDVDGGKWTVDGASDYDAINIAAGATLANTISVEHSMTITVGGTLDSGDDRAIEATDGLDDGSTLTVNVLKGGVISSSGDDAIAIKDSFENGHVTIDNAGTIRSTGGGQQALDLTDLTSTTTTIHITNQKDGLITAVGADAIRGGGNTTIDNYGIITSVATTDDLNDAIDFQDEGGGTVHNYAGGSITGAGHAITGTRGITVINDADASIIGQSGSAVNIDNDGDEANKVTVTNYGTMLGMANASQDDSDGDAVDVDGLLQLDNHGEIRGLGANGTHKGGANVSEGVAAGGGTINNYASATIYGYGRAIQIDDSENGGALAATTIYNEGTIQGDGHGPENFEPGSDAGINLAGREAIDILGSFNDTIINKGTIIGGVFTDGGDDTFNAYVGSTSGKIDLGAGNDTVNLFATDGSSAKGTLGTAVNAENLNVKGGTWKFTDGAANFTNITVDDGATVTTGIILGDGDHLVVKAGGTVTMSDAGSGGVSAVQWTGGTTTIDNYGTITATATNGNGIRGTVQGAGDLTFVNHEGAEVDALLYVTGPAGSSAHITNAGNMMQISAKAPMDVTIDNSGLITTDKANRDLVKLGGSVHLTNSGQIISKADSGTDNGGEAVEYGSGGTGVFITNKSGGLIEGSHHAITGESGATIVNEAGATLIGRNGSGINVDNDETIENTVYVTNKGDILGKSQGYADSDGDAIDVDGLVQIENWGNVKGLGANGYHKGTAATDANISEGIAVGGGSIINHEGGMIYGYGRAIQIDDSSNGPAHAATTIVNEGTIQGDGHGPTGVDPAHAAEMQARIDGAEAINIVGNLADTITNTATGKILGGIFTDGGADTLSNAGSIKALAGSAVNMGAGDDIVTNTGSITGAVLLGAGNDVFNAGVGSTSGTIDGGDDVDTVNLQGTGTGSFGTTTNVENLNVKSGTWTIAGTQNYKAIDVANGATIAAAVILGANETLTIEQGGTVQASGGVIVVNGGTQDTLVTNDGTIKVTAAAGNKIDAITVNSGTMTVHNTEHGVIEGARHAITGPGAITVINDAGGLIVGHNGSAVNMDNGSSEAEAAHITNYGIMRGESANISDSDGDAVDVDGLVYLDNHGTISGVGANGTHKGEANVSEGVAAGGGTIHNYAGATIYGYGRAIQIDNSSNGTAYASTTIINEGTIQGDGHPPQNYETGSANNIHVDDREAIDILGGFADTITNKGTILGGVFTDGGNDTLTNSGTMTALKDMAIDMGAGDDSVTNNATGVITGSVALGDGNDSLSNDGTITVTHGNAVSMGAGDDFMVTRNTITGNVDMGAGNDEMISFGRILGAVSFGDGNDHFNNSNAIEAGAGAVAIDMGAGDDWVNLYTGTSVQGTIQLGTGNDILNSTADGSYVVDAGDGNDSVAMSGGDDIINGGAGNDSLDGGTGNDQVDGGEGDDTLFGGDGNDTVIGGTGSDLYYYWSGDGNDTIVEGAGNAGDFDTLSLGDFNISDVTLAQNGDDLEITMKDGSKVVVSDQFAGGGVENIVLKDGEIDRNDIVDATNHAPTVDPTVVRVDEDKRAGGQITATDLDGDKLTYTMKNDGAVHHGSLFLSDDGEWTYTPNHNFNGHDIFTVLVSDGHTTVETTIDVTVDPVNDAPVAQNDIGQVGEHDTKTFDLAGNDTDVEDGHPHLVGFNIDGVDGINLTKDAVANAFQIVDGKLQFVGGDIFGALNDGQHATVHITYTAEDSNGAPTTGEFTLTVDGVTDVHSIDGTNGSDVLFDTGVDDHINGRDGNDVIFSQSGSDIVDAGGGNDTVMATTGNATVNGGDGNDSIIGGSGNTVLNGDNGNDTITGGSGSEVMNGGAGNDTLISNGGNDILAGGQGNDLLIGGTGSDTFVFKPGDGQDTVANFKAAGTAHDVIEVDTHAFADFDALMAAVHDTATGAQLQYTDGSTLTLSGVTKAHLTVDDFKFA